VTSGELAALAMAAVLAVAAVAKLVDHPGARESLKGFGVPEAAAGPLSVALPLVELTLAGLLVVPATRAAGAAGALVLLIAFTGGIARALAGGRPGDCRCFGQLTAGRAGYGALLRNVVLVALAAGVLVQEASR
jgi:hypothetical protein